jgi:hypothetical protein
MDRFLNEQKSVAKTMRRQAIQWYREECECVVPRQHPQSQITRSSRLPYVAVVDSSQGR